MGWYDLAKRVIDLIGATVGLVLGSPLFLMIALIIKLDSRGPVFFNQRRLGIRGKEFSLIKFRTMVDGAEKILKENPQMLEAYVKNGFKLRQDPRVTKVGKLLRRLSLDELPQLINILRGEMSLVGPRPYTKANIDITLDQEPQLKETLYAVLDLKPGLTGIWQISGRSELCCKERILLDYEYLMERSLLLDIVLICKTFTAVITLRGAW
jgi:exopolysaccharide production protein ExoY